jgi:hypothetical protein
VESPSEPPPIPNVPVETIIMVEGGQTLAFVEGVVWPPVGSVVELGNPNRDAIVRDVRLRLFPSKASVVVRVDELPEGGTIPVPDAPVDRGGEPT